MPTEIKRFLYHRIFSALPLVTYVIFLGSATIFVATHPKIGWDMLGYIGVIESWHTSDGKMIQDEVYSAIRSLPEYDELTGQSACQPPAYASYRADVAHNSAHFVQQLPILAIKPLYVVFIWALHSGRLSYIQSFEALSAIVYCGLGILIWVWLSRYWAKWSATVFGGLLMINPEFLFVARSSSPDALALLFLCWGLYMLLEHPISIWGPLLLIISIWVRPDVLVLVGLLLVTSLLLRAVPNIMLSWSDRSAKWASLRIVIAKNWNWVVLCMLALSSYFAIQRFAHAYSWSTLFYHSFVGYLVAPAETLVHITPQLYFHAFATNSRTLLGNSEVVLLLLMGSIATLLHTQLNYRYVTISVIASIFAHFIFFPSDSPRFHVAMTTFTPISLLIACAQYTTPSERSDSSFEEK
jgi:hypothetical protein